MPDDELDELIGYHQDLILDEYGKPYRITKAGRDENGLVVRWHYKQFVLTFSKVLDTDPVFKKKFSVYVVTKVIRKGEQNVG